MPGERLLPECIVPPVKFGGGGIMVWGGFSWYELGFLISIHDKFNANFASNIIDSNALPMLLQFYEFHSCYFLEDNTTCHVAKSTMDLYDDNGVSRLDWPA
ncbi:transposable element Tc1 transposase [Trichonephila clavata]|uniref:Transposable element Tc1 transposase n=1 Tax=Trichonephila clavata TaxID=2740835 RepID=A0A8X6G6Z0_TRICU|nr:transposable element Tc1 transposase [Trichonephila clavata]